MDVAKVKIEQDREARGWETEIWKEVMREWPCQGCSNWGLLLRARTPLVPVPELDPQPLL